MTSGEYGIIGRVLGPAWGIVTLGVNMVANILAMSILALGISVYLKPVFPNLDPVATGIITLILATLCGILHIRTNAVVTGLFLGIEMLALGILTWLGLTHMQRGLPEIIIHPLHLGDAGLLPATPGMIGLATSVAIFAYNGYGQAVYLGEEIHNAPKRIARTIFLAFFITILTETIPVTAVLLGAPDLQSLFGASDMFGNFIAKSGGDTLNLVVSLGIALAVFNALIALVLMIARNVYSTGRDHIWSAPINRALTLVHDRFHSPWVATLVCGGIAMAFCFVDPQILLLVTATGMVAIYALLSLAALVGRRNGTTAHASYKMPLFPLVPLLALIMMAYVLYANYLDDSVGRPSLFVTVAIMIASGLYYAFVLCRRKDWRLRGPDVSN